MTDIVAPEPPHHHRKKTWVTDVNVYSKKKNGDDLNEFFNDDNDPLDEFGKYCTTLVFIYFLMRHFVLWNCSDHVSIFTRENLMRKKRTAPFLFSRRSMNKFKYSQLRFFN